MEEVKKCEICGEPMPPGEQMFKFHGYSGPCPKPPLPLKPGIFDCTFVEDPPEGFESWYGWCASLPKNIRIVGGTFRIIK